MWRERVASTLFQLYHITTITTTHHHLRPSGSFTHSINHRIMAASSPNQALDSPTSIVEFAKSKLGTKQYWDDIYARDLAEFNASKDAGDVWFGQQYVDKMLRIVEALPGVDHRSPIVDIGTGNGHSLVEFAKHGFSALVGTDYSHEAVALAVAYVQDEQVEDKVRVVRDDVLDSKLERAKYHVVLDKGTFDAIMLNPDGSQEKARSQYIDTVYYVLRPTIDANGVATPAYLVISSCNYTQDELTALFVASDKFVFRSAAKYSGFRFGGVEGFKACTVCFEKKL
jgi:EEF1A lysine methyltransferase 2